MDASVSDNILEPMAKIGITCRANELIECVKHNQFDKAKLILKGLNKEERREIVNTAWPQHGHTPLTLAAQLGHVHFVNYLLECGADIEQRGLFVHVTDKGTTDHQVSLCVFTSMIQQPKVYCLKQTVRLLCL